MNDQTGSDNLTDLISQMRGNYSEEFCKYSMYQTLKILCELHRQNIVHRDVKSDNILVNEEGKHEMTGLYYSAVLTQQK